MPSYSYLSMRASCDRCRFHKLKCILSSEANPGEHQCARCIRAKVECVYSQRSRAKRQQTGAFMVSDAAANRQTSGEQSVGPPTPPPTGPPSTAAGAEDFNSLESLSCMNPSDTWDLQDTPGCGPLSEGRGDLVQIPTFGSLAQEQPGVSAVGTGGPLISSVFGSALLTRCEQPMPQSTVLLECQDSVLGSSGSSLSPSMHECLRSKAHGNLDSHLTPSITQLSNLVADIHKTLALLSADCHGARCPNFNFSEYPIGTVLHLARDLMDIISQTESARDISRTPWESDVTIPDTTAFTHDTTAVSGGNNSGLPLSSTLNDDFFTDLAGLSPPLSCTTAATRRLNDTMDTPTRTLALSCYFSLRQLYYLVFTHFEVHLRLLPRQAPSSSHGLLLAPNLAGERNLQLGELPSADETCSRINTAVRLVLEVLQSTEDMLGLPNANMMGAAARGCQEATPCGHPLQMILTAAEGLQDESPSVYGELAGAFSDQSPAMGSGSNCAHDNLDGLGTKVQSVKRLLRERMDL